MLPTPNIIYILILGICTCTLYGKSVFADVNNDPEMGKVFWVI
jgi:hypothetical protein